jgi:beta-mannosidase
LRGGRELASAFHFPRGRRAAMHAAKISASLQREGGEWMLGLSTDRLAQSVNLSVPGWMPDDNWFHLPPGREKKIRISNFSAGVNNKLEGMIRHLGASAVVNI